jgi:coenzyme F420-dependent glucose-6-phosphate dehydrogenase
VNAGRAPSEDEGAEIVHRIWPNAAVGGDLGYELPLPRHFEQAGFTHVYLHQIGREQEGFFRFWREELQPRL